MFKRLCNALIISVLLGCSVAAAADKNPVVQMETTLGTIKIELFAKEAPISVKNFLAYANSGYYNGTIFHRVIKGFMAQGGGLTAELQPKPGDRPPIKNEAGNGIKNDRGTVAMARTGVVDSATSQFFINLVDNNFLNHSDETSRGFGYAVFGKVIEGMEVADKMAAAPQQRKNAVFQNVPETPIVIKSVKILK
jgi:peptidyl-prolyl cis-trans isomerase A (cyclophilin A)